MTQTAATVVRRNVVVDAPIARAFEVFTGRFGDFKPPEHNLLRVAIAETVFEPKAGGHIYDRGVDGSECRCTWTATPQCSPRTADTSTVDGGCGRPLLRRSHSSRSATVARATRTGAGTPTERSGRCLPFQRRNAGRRSPRCSTASRTPT